MTYSIPTAPTFYPVAILIFVNIILVKFKSMCESCACSNSLISGYPEVKPKE